MPDYESLRDLGGRLEPPLLLELEEVAKRRGRLIAVAGALGGVLAAVVVAFLVGVVPRTDDAVPNPIDTPTPSVTPTGKDTGSPSPDPDETPTHASDTSMTPREVVTAGNAVLVLSGVSADDPDFRFGLWSARCRWCPKGESRFKPTFYGIAFTTDGFASTTYLRLPIKRLLDETYSGLFHVESVGPGMLLLLDVGNDAPGWLLRDDGSLTRLAQVVEDRPAADPRLWFLCHDINEDDGGELVTWCALDPGTNTSYIWHDPWRNPLYDPPAVDPGSGELPWGFVDAPDDHLLAYWWDGGTRHTRDFGLAASEGAVAGMPDGEMAVWSLDERSRVLTIHASSDRGRSWQITQLQAPFYSLDLTVWRTPSGGLLAREDDAFYAEDSAQEAAGIRIWRADALDAPRLEVVYGANPRVDRPSIFVPPFSVVNGRIWTGALWSDDDGRTWSEVSGWR